MLPSRASTCASNIRHINCRANGAGTISVLKEPTSRTLEVVPPLGRLHATKQGLQVHEGTIAGGTAQRGRRDFGAARHDGRSGRTLFALVARCTWSLAHARGWSNRLATSRPRKRVHLAAAVSFSPR